MLSHGYWNLTYPTTLLTLPASGARFEIFVTRVLLAQVEDRLAVAESKLKRVDLRQKEMDLQLATMTIRMEGMESALSELSVEEELTM